MPRIVFMGSPAFAVPSLRAIADSVVGVVTQPDRPAGRGNALTPPAIKQAGLELDLPVIQPDHMREAIDQLRAWKPNLILVVAFGKILKQEVLDLPPLGCLNLHASLLPQYRGAAPIPAAILAGETKTGVTLMKLDAGLDTGPMLAQRTYIMNPVETASQVADGLSLMGAELLRELLPVYLSGKLDLVPQEDALASYAPQLKKEDGLLQFTNSAEALVYRIRAMTDWPGAFVHVNGEPLKVLRAHAQPDLTAAPGLVIQVDGCPAIGTLEGVLVLEEVQPAGKKAMDAASFLNGHPNFVGQRL